MPDLGVWSNSRPLGGDLADGTRRFAPRPDVVLIGSTGVVRALAAAGVVDEYRLLTVSTFVRRIGLSSPGG